MQNNPNKINTIVSDIEVLLRQGYFFNFFKISNETFPFFLGVRSLNAYEIKCIQQKVELRFGEQDEPQIYPKIINFYCFLQSISMVNSWEICDVRDYEKFLSEIPYSFIEKVIDYLYKQYDILQKFYRLIPSYVIYSKNFLFCSSEEGHSLCSSGFSGIPGRELLPLSDIQSYWRWVASTYHTYYKANRFREAVSFVASLADKDGGRKVLSGVSQSEEEAREEAEKHLLGEASSGFSRIFHDHDITSKEGLESMLNDAVSGKKDLHDKLMDLANSN